LESARSEVALEPLVLIVDDDRGTRLLYQDILIRAGFRTTDAHNGHQALAKALELRPQAVLTDLAVPGMDGFEFCRALKQSMEMCRVPILAVTGHPEYLEHPNRFHDAGIAHVLMKPCDPGELVEELRRLMGRSLACPTPSPSR
jgi:two-component system, cell cycle response regulator DivK